METLIHQEAQSHSWYKCIPKVLMSSFEFSGGINLLACKLSGGSICEELELDQNIEEADLKTVVHALHATKDGSKRLVMLSIDTDVFILLVHYWRELKAQGLEELWIKTGTVDSSRYVPIHTLAAQLGQELCQVLPAVHSLTGCDYCSKFGTKLSSLKANPEAYLKDFGTMNDIEKQIALPEEYLVKVVRKPSTGKTTDQLRDLSLSSCKVSIPATHQLCN